MSGGKIVEAAYGMARRQQPIDEIAANKSSGSGDQCFHGKTAPAALAGNRSASGNRLLSRAVSEILIGVAKQLQNRLKIFVVNLGCNGTLQQTQGNNDPPAVPEIQQQTFHPIQRAADNTYLLSDSQKGQGAAGRRSTTDFILAISSSSIGAGSFPKLTTDTTPGV